MHTYQVFCDLVIVFMLILKQLYIILILCTHAQLLKQKDTNNSNN